MKVLTPTNDIAEIKPLLKNGCDEFYIGVLTDEWRANYHDSASSNRREWASASLTSYDQLREVVKMAHDGGARIFLALNGIYSAPQYELMTKELDLIVETGVDAAIVADLGLMNKIVQDRLPLKIHVSTGGTCFNKSTVSFYKEKFDVERIIIPRHVTVDEIADMTESKEDVELEIFVLNGRCPNIDGFCTFQHGMKLKQTRKRKLAPLVSRINDFCLRHEDKIEKVAKKMRLASRLMHASTGCGLGYDVEVRSREVPQKGVTVKDIQQRIADSYIAMRARYACGCCALYRLKEMKIDSLKIVGRDNPTEKKIKDVGFIRGALNLLRDATDETNYRTGVRKLYRQIYGFECKDNCYYQLNGGMDDRVGILR